jgi:hypothetical protein
MNGYVREFVEGRPPIYFPIRDLHCPSFLDDRASRIFTKPSSIRSEKYLVANAFLCSLSTCLILPIAFTSYLVTRTRSMIVYVKTKVSNRSCCVP